MQKIQIKKEWDAKAFGILLQHGIVRAVLPIDPPTYIVFDEQIENLKAVGIPFTVLKKKGGKTMPALNHSDPLIQNAVAFSSMHHALANNISADLNEILPEGFVAHPHASLGRGWEADVITKEELNLTTDFVPYQPPKASGISKVVFPTSVSVIIDYLRNRTREKIVAAIEIVSPANKDRGPKRQAFLAKCHSYLQENVSLVIIDITSSYREHNLHFELLKALNVKIGNFWGSDETPLYCASYRTNVDEENDTVVEYWVELFKAGDMLPTIPLYITEEIAVPLELEKTYMKTCKSLRVFSRLERFRYLVSIRSATQPKSHST